MHAHLNSHMKIFIHSSQQTYATYTTLIFSENHCCGNSFIYAKENPANEDIYPYFKSKKKKKRAQMPENLRKN